MQEVSSPFSSTPIEFPRQTSLIKRLRFISFLINDVTLLVSFLILLIWLTKLVDLRGFFFHQLGIYPFAAVLFMLAGSSLLFGSRRHLISADKHADDARGLNVWAPITLALVTAFLGLINFFYLTNSSLLTLFRITPFSGFCFFIIGLALIPPFTRIPHRFHITQFLIFLVSGLNVFVVLESTYQFIASHPMEQMVYVPLPTAMMFVFFCFGILLRWTNRGFVGNFTLDSTGSRFAFRLIIINIISAPLIAFIVLLAMQKTSYNPYQVLTVIVVLITFLSSTILWVNVKLLYKYEFEHLLMRESLRMHNIDLASEKETLQVSMAQLENEKKQYLDKLNTKNSIQDVTDSLR